MAFLDNPSYFSIDNNSDEGEVTLLLDEGKTKGGVASGLGTIGQADGSKFAGVSFSAGKVGEGKFADGEGPKCSDHRFPDQQFPDQKFLDHKFPDHKLPDHKCPDQKLPDLKFSDHRFPDQKLSDQIFSTQKFSQNKKGSRGLLRTMSNTSADSNHELLIMGEPRLSDIAPDLAGYKTNAEPRRSNSLKNKAEPLQNNDFNYCPIPNHEAQEPAATYYNCTATDARRRHSIGTFMSRERSTSVASSKSYKDETVHAMLPSTPDGDGTIPKKPSNAADILIISYKNSQAPNLWVDYFTSYCEQISKQANRKKFKIQHLGIEEIVEANGDVAYIAEKTALVKLQLIIICPSLLEHASNYPEPAGSVGKLIFPDRALALLLGVTDEDITSVHLNAFLTYPQWQRLSVEQDEDANFTKNFLSTAMTIFSKVWKKQTSVIQEQSQFSVTPKKVTPGQNSVVILLNTPLQKDDILKISVEKNNELVEISSYRRRNPYTIKLTIPERLTEVSAIVNVVVEKNSRIIGNRPIKCESRMRELEQILKASTNPVGFLCQALGFGVHDKEKLDDTMQRLFLQNVPPHFNLFGNHLGSGYGSYGNGSNGNGSHGNGSHRNGSHGNGSHGNGSHGNGSHGDGSQGNCLGPLGPGFNLPIGYTPPPNGYGHGPYGSSGVGVSGLSYDIPQKHSREEFPTLLHFAAKFGLEKLTMQLLDCPGGDLACEIQNSCNLIPADIADAAGHVEVSNILRGYMKMNEFTTTYAKLKELSLRTRDNQLEGVDDELYLIPRSAEEVYKICPPPRPVNPVGYMRGIMEENPVFDEGENGVNAGGTSQGGTSKRGSYQSETSQDGIYGPFQSGGSQGGTFQGGTYTTQEIILGTYERTSHGTSIVGGTNENLTTKEVTSKEGCSISKDCCGASKEKKGKSKDDQTACKDETTKDKKKTKEKTKDGGTKEKSKISKENKTSKENLKASKESLKALKEATKASKETLKASKETLKASKETTSKETTSKETLKTTKETIKPSKENFKSSLKESPRTSKETQTSKEMQPFLEGSYRPLDENHPSLGGYMAMNLINPKKQGEPKLTSRENLKRDSFLSDHNSSAESLQPLNIHNHDFTNHESSTFDSNYENPDLDFETYNQKSTSNSKPEPPNRNPDQISRPNNLSVNFSINHSVNPPSNQSVIPTNQSIIPTNHSFNLPPNMRPQDIPLRNTDFTRRSPPALEDKVQTELLEIINDFKNNVHSIAQAEKLVEEWKCRNEVQKSFKEKQEQLHHMRLRYEKMQQEMKGDAKKHNPFERFLRLFTRSKQSLPSSSSSNSGRMSIISGSSVGDGQSDTMEQTDRLEQIDEMDKYQMDETDQNNRMIRRDQSPGRDQSGRDQSPGIDQTDAPVEIQPQADFKQSETDFSRAMSLNYMIPPAPKPVKFIQNKCLITQNKGKGFPTIEKVFPTIEEGPSRSISGLDISQLGSFKSCVPQGSIMGPQSGSKDKNYDLEHPDLRNPDYLRDPEYALEDRKYALGDPKYALEDSKYALRDSEYALRSSLKLAVGDGPNFNFDDDSQDSYYVNVATPMSEDSFNPGHDYMNFLHPSQNDA